MIETLEKKLTVSDFDYYLPEELIAQTPAEKRDKSRLLVVNRATRMMSDKIFSEITDYFDENDVLIFNDSKVIPVRLLFHKNGKEYEIFLLKRLESRKPGEEIWEALVRPGKKIKKGFTIETLDNNLKITVLDFLPLKGGRKVKLEFSPERWANIYAVLDTYGKVPLPPYIKKYTGDLNRYQTVYAKNPGSSAAPTAGLHFTDKILKSLKQNGVKILFVTLHVGLGTFRPVTVEDISEHQMHTEAFSISREVVKEIQIAKNAGKRITACGTTTVRVLETVAAEILRSSQSSSLTGETDIFIYPGYEFKLIDRMVTNFHLPRSTLLMLVSAFADLQLIKNAYQHAIQEKYSFFSFGDGMLII
jgi:S-adenosylmethionine:tRNA ribosyltransferase-isomerase